MLARLVVAGCVLLVAFPAAAQDTAFVKALRGHSASFEIREGRLTGPGADALSSVAREHAFIGIGEDHGIREVPQFVSALWTTARPHGFNHVAVEIGPISGRRLETMMRSPTASRDLHAFLGKYTAFTFPFFFWREEAEMLEQIVKSVPSRRDVVWGVDQEFMVAPTYLLERLAQLAPDAAARTLATSFAESSAKGDRELMEKGSMAGVWMIATTDADIAGLRTAFKPARGSEADEIISELAVSRDIYRRFNSGAGYEANQQRDDLMKTNFVRFYRAAKARGEKQPKAIIKLGANHVFRGPSITSTYELGSFLPEFAVLEGVKSFGILLVAGKGTWNAYRPMGSTEADKTKAYDPLATPEYSVFDLRSVLEATGTRSWAFVDLRPLRAMAVNGPLRRLSPEARRLLNSFDGIVVAPEAHASVLIR